MRSWGAIIAAAAVAIGGVVTNALHWTEKQHLQEKAKEMFFHGYNSYMTHAYPWDELKPLSCEGRRWDRKERGDLDDALGGFALTVSFDRDVTVSVFESTIRVIGGLLSAHMLATAVGSMHLAYQGELLDLAVDLGTRLLPAFNTKTGLPVHRVNLMVDAVLGLWDRRSDLNLLGSTINVNTGDWVHTHTGIGAGLDSFYEYLLKYYILSGDSDFLDMFNKSYVSIETHLLHRDGYHREVDMSLGHIYSNRVSALQAFWPGLQVLAGDLSAAVRSHHQLFDLWNEFGALPELYDRSGKGSVIHWAQHYPLRPELAESTYHLYAATKDEKYLKIGRKLLQDIEDTSRVGNVHDKRLEDRMDSFFLSETVKYLYLLFSNDTSVLIPKHATNQNSLSASHVLFTTEGHLFPIVPSLYQDATSKRRKFVRQAHQHRTCAAPQHSALTSKEGSIRGKIVLVKRGKCSFTRKAMHIQQMGGIGMIAVNSKPTTAANAHRLYSLSDDGAGHHVTIPVVMISKPDGQHLQHNVAHRDGDLVVSLSMLLA
ncbi:hypothetical protein B5M09_006229 [Aphanomyces astaci]|uniref:alpha-1,2-Mannosidase n=1 Tax=Aphanomyces astaci TaxID=112090 RepID=A0A3R7XPQ4_APHAT|nr:hypothetical protein B5M09_006229 [Aphanomyces astaci]